MNFTIKFKEPHLLCLINVKGKLILRILSPKVNNKNQVKTKAGPQSQGADQEIGLKASRLVLPGSDNFGKITVSGFEVGLVVKVYLHPP